jgi:hypothetical protein
MALGSSADFFEARLIHLVAFVSANLCDLITDLDRCAASGVCTYANGTCMQGVLVFF